uniref:Uncharacterized protein n=1 Tax=Arundo donax TaxID=35708 RepID=A0A0A9GFS3_ARUDO
MVRRPQFDHWSGTSLLTIGMQELQPRCTGPRLPPVLQSSERGV